jgi:hypothetical protein
MRWREQGEVKVKVIRGAVDLGKLNGCEVLCVSFFGRQNI